VRAAARARIPYGLSTMRTTSIDGVRAAAPESDVWFQLYVWRDRERSKEIILRARDGGARVLVLTVDTPVTGARLRDTRSGLTIPPTLTLRTLLEFARHPGWWFDVVTTEPFSFANFDEPPSAVPELVRMMFDPGVTLKDFAWIRDMWDGPIVVKGIQRVDDALAVVDVGADGVVLSHHGGRQLDRSAPPLHLLPAVVRAVGDRTEVFVDSGVMSGADIVAAVALGARACLVGRAYLYGLMAGGERGVDRAVTLLSEEFTRTMRLLGVRDVTELTPDLVTLGGPGRPATPEERRRP